MSNIILWVNSGAGIPDNEKQHFLAKEAALNTNIEINYDFCLIS